jgi:hypothetical protein
MMKLVNNMLGSYNDPILTLFGTKLIDDDPTACRKMATKTLETLSVLPKMSQHEQGEPDPKKAIDSCRTEQFSSLLCTE